MALEGERTRPGLAMYGPRGVTKRGGVFLEAATRHCEIKISWQEMFAIPVPVPARRAESTELWEASLSSPQRTVRDTPRSLRAVCLWRETPVLRHQRRHQESS